jgi:hypothetical protein
MKDIQWFKDHIDETVVRTFDGRSTEFMVTEQNYKYLQLYAQKGYDFAVKPRVHSGPPDSLCTACKS